MRGPLRLAILRNLTWSMPAGLIEAIVKAAAVVLLARILGPTEFGLIVLILSIVAFLGLLSDVGISAATARRLSEAPDSARSTLAVSVRMLSVLLVVVGGAVVMLAAWIGRTLGAPELADLRWLVALLLLAAVGRKFIAKFFEGLGRVDVAGKVLVAIGWAPWLLALMLVLWVAPRASWALIGHLGANLLVVGVLAVLLARLLRQETTGTGQATSSRQLARYALPMVATAAGFLVYTQVDVILVQYFMSTDQVGIYGTAVRLIDLLHVPAAAVGASVAVFFVELVRTRSSQAGHLFELVTRSLLFLYLPVAALLLLFAREAVVLIFGPSYAPAGAIVAIYVPFLVLKALAGTYSMALDYLGFATRRAVLVSVSAVANVGLNLLLIPRYGIVGAAVATQLSYAPLVLYYMWLLATESGAAMMSPPAFRTALAASMSGAATFLLARWMDAHFVVWIVAFALIYFVIAVGLRAVSRDEWRTLRSYVGTDPDRRRAKATPIDGPRAGPGGHA